MSLDFRDDGATLAFTLNGVRVTVATSPLARLSEVLRDALGARDVKVGCNAGDCGACTVLIDGAALCACITPVCQAAGARVETLAGLAVDDPIAGRLGAAFLRHGAAQCGICTPGLIVSAVALLQRTPRPDARSARDALGGVLCRCTGYRRIVAAVCDAHGGAVLAPEGGVGASVARVDGVAKVSGTEIFGDDAAPADALSLRVLRSPLPHARFEFGDIEAWRAAHPGVELVLTAADIPGVNRFGVIPGFIDQPVFAESIARFDGEAVAAVVGEPASVAALDLGAFPVRWHALPAVRTLADARLADAPLLHEGRAGNVMCRGLVRRGDAARALATADVIAEGRFATGFVEHAYIEPEAGFACRVGDRIEVHACTQAPAMNRASIAAILGLTEDRVRVVPTAVGGGFGSKLDLTTQPFVALAAWWLGRPVRMAYTRSESMRSTTKRHPSEIAMRIGARRDGRLCAIDMHGAFNTGAHASWGPTVANRVPIHASGPYFTPHYLARTEAIHTHCAPSGAFRGFGVPQAAVAQESLFDELANRLGIDRLEFRRINALKNGEATVTGQVFAGSVGIGACFEALRAPWTRALAEAAAENARTMAAGGPMRRGVGVAGGWYGCGNTSLPNPSTIKAGIRADGTLILHQGAVDIGQGANTVISQIFAQALGVPLTAVTLIGADTDLTPDAGKTSASRQTFVSGNAARLAGLALRARLLRLGNVGPSVCIATGRGEILLTDGGQRRRIDLSALDVDEDGYVISAAGTYDPPTGSLDADGQGAPYAQFGYAAQMVEVDVDTGLGRVHPVRVTAAHDVGRAINPLMVAGQVEGGVAQGLGMALMEAFVPGRTDNLHDYLIPTFGDVPPIETIIVEVPDPSGPFGAKGLGEHALIPTAPAVLNAIAHACGARVRTLPATPERVLEALAQAKGAPW